MKHSYFYVALAAGILLGGMPQVTFADDAEATPAATKSVKKGKKAQKGKKSKKVKAAEWSPELKAALEGCNFYNGVTPNPQARYFVLLESASWCGPCKAVMPQVVAAYPAMKEGDVEVILLNKDKTPEAAQKYVDDYKMEFPAVMVAGMPKIPGHVSGPGIPFMTIIDAEGNTVQSGHGQMSLQWKQLTENYEKKGGAAKKAVEDETEADDEEEKKDDGPGAVVEAMKDVKFLGGKPSKKADYFIYLHSASWCGPCKAIMPDIVKEYRKMKKAGVEVILMGHDKDEKGVKSYLKSYKAKMPALVSTSDEAKAMPGNKAIGGIPHAIIVDKDGNIVREGHGKIVLDWKEICK